MGAGPTTRRRRSTERGMDCRGPGRALTQGRRWRWQCGGKGGGSRGGRGAGRMDLGLWLMLALGGCFCSPRPFGALQGSVQGAGQGAAAPGAVQAGRYFLNMSCSGPGRYLMTVSRMLSSSSSCSSPQPGGMAFLGRVRLPSALASMAACASASRSSFFLMPYCRESRESGQAGAVPILVRAASVGSPGTQASWTLPALGDGDPERGTSG